MPGPAELPFSLMGLGKLDTTPQSWPLDSLGQSWVACVRAFTRCRRKADPNKA